MKNVALGLLALALATSASVVSAQACGTVSTTISSPVTDLSGNSCQASSTLANTCQNQDSLNGAGVAIFNLTVGAGNHGVQISANSAAFAPYIALIKPSANNCNSIGPCAFDPQSAAANTAASGTLPDSSPAGTYWIVVGDTGADSPGCGAFGLTVTATLPVQLQKFSVD